MRILVFDDSIACARRLLRSRKRWLGSALFLKLIRAKVQNPSARDEMFNLGVSGEMMGNLIGRIRNEIESRQWGEEPVTVVVAIGLNDARVENEAPISTVERYLGQLRELYDIAMSIADKVLFVGLTPVDESKSAPWIYNSGSQKLHWRNKRIHEFDQALQNFAYKKDAPFVPVFEVFQERQKHGDNLLADGLHPNNAGHELIASLVPPALDKLLVN